MEEEFRVGGKREQRERRTEVRGEHRRTSRVGLGGLQPLKRGHIDCRVGEDRRGQGWGVLGTRGHSIARPFGFENKNHKLNAAQSFSPRMVTWKL